MAEPLYYSMGAGSELLQVEAQLIADNEAATRGFNVMASSVEYGPRFGELVRLGSQPPEVRAKRSASARKSWGDPAIKAARLEATKATRVANAERFRAQEQTPELRAKIAAGVRKKVDTDPEFAAACAARARALSNTPELVALRAESICNAYAKRPELRQGAADRARGLHAARREWASRTGYAGSLSKVTKAMMEA